jgi:hypothetical protein
VIASSYLAKPLVVLTALLVLFAAPASADTSYAMFVGGTILSVEGQEIVFRDEGGPGIRKNLGDIVKVRLKGDEKIWVATPLKSSDLRPDEWINVRTQTDRTDLYKLSDEAHPLHAENIEIPLYRTHRSALGQGRANHVSYYGSPQALLVFGQIASIAKSGDNYMLTIPTPTDGNCPGCVQFVEVDGATSIVTYAPGDATALIPGLQVSLSGLSKISGNDVFWVGVHTLLVGKGFIIFKSNY